MVVPQGSEGATGESEFAANEPGCAPGRPAGMRSGFRSGLHETEGASPGHVCQHRRRRSCRTAHQFPFGHSRCSPAHCPRSPRWWPGACRFGSRLRLNATRSSTAACRSAARLGTACRIMCFVPSCCPRRVCWRCSGCWQHAGCTACTARAGWRRWGSRPQLLLRCTVRSSAPKALPAEKRLSDAQAVPAERADADTDTDAVE